MRPKTIFLKYPKDERVLASVGRIAISHGHLDHMLRMTVKTLTAVSVDEAIGATRHQGSRALRERVRKLAATRLGEGQALVKLEGLLDRAKLATDRRNELVHDLWAQTEDGTPTWGGRLIPSVEELEAAANDLSQVARELNYARLKGFLAEALGCSAQRRRGKRP